MRIYLASDFHAAEKAWRKFLNAIKLNVYKADVALVAGDLTGKAIVPIVRRGGAYEAELFGVRRRAGSDDELAVLQRDIADVGFYSFISTAEEAERLATDPEARGELLHDLMNERVSEWLDLADERLGGGAVPLYLIPGNDDDFAIDPILNRDGAFAQNADGRVLDVPGDLQLLASGWSNITPWATPREEPEEVLEARLEALATQVRDPRRSIFMIHVPPHDSGLDTAPILDENLRPTISAGDVLRGPVGSRPSGGSSSGMSPCSASTATSTSRAASAASAGRSASTRAARPTTASCAATWSTSARTASSARCAWRASQAQAASRTSAGAFSQ